MARTLEQVLGYVYLTGMIQAVKTGIPKVLPENFWKVKTTTVGDQGRYTQVSGTRQTARLAMYGSPAIKTALKGIATKDVKLMHTFEEIQMNPLTLQALRNYTDYNVQRMGMDEVDRQILEFRTRFDNLRLATVYSMLANTTVWFDENGNLLPTSSGAVVTVDYGVSANNKNQLNGIITSSWANANTNIPAQLRALQDRSAQLTGYPLKYAFYGASIPTYLTNNNYVIDYLSRNVPMAQKFLDNNTVPDGLFGFTWLPVHTAFYEDQNGTNRTFFGADAVTFTPEIDQTVYELIEGTYLVPSSFNATRDMASALASLSQVEGMFSYAVPTHNPPSCSMFMGDVFLPVWKVVDAIFTSDTTP